jgi:hypothetical protein
MYGRNQGGSPSPNPASPTIAGGPTRVCGPDVTKEAAAMWTQIQRDFRSWSPEQKASACMRVMVPLQRPSGEFKKDKVGYLRSMADIDGWDVIPLYQGGSDWLRKPPVYDALLNGPCATPTSTDPTNDSPFAIGHEDETTCSNTVQVAGKCWLNGSVNYGTFGIMVRLCHNEFPIKYALGLQMAKTLIHTYKTIGAKPEGATVPIAWVEATYNGGPTATPTIAGDRPRCQCSCTCSGGVVPWDYVWEPVKPR